ncbi:MAG: hypothetical protein V2J51_12130 [Erythrobacter sp.]|nr:hypothetical protein [Erythrobacter sp.]
MKQDDLIGSVEPQANLAEVHQWFALVLTSFAEAEQAIGALCIRLDLSTRNGPLENNRELIRRLALVGDRRCRSLARRIERWRSLRAVRHLLAHATLKIVYDEKENPLVVTRHFPRDLDVVTCDRVWSDEERQELRRIAASDGRSIHDHVRNLLKDPKTIEQLSKL